VPADFAGTADFSLPDFGCVFLGGLSCRATVCFFGVLAEALACFAAREVSAIAGVRVPSSGVHKRASVISEGNRFIECGKGSGYDPMMEGPTRKYRAWSGDAW
jgi:hypothetical protein